MLRVRLFCLITSICVFGLQSQSGVANEAASMAAAEKSFGERHLLLVFSDPPAGKEKEYDGRRKSANECAASNVLMPTAVRRFKLSDAQLTLQTGANERVLQSGTRHLSIYEFHSPDLGAVTKASVACIRAESKDPHVDQNTLSYQLYTAITPRITDPLPRPDLNPPPPYFKDPVQAHRASTASAQQISSSAKHLLLTFTRPLEGKDGKYNEWYQHVHMRDGLNIRGYLASQRFRLHDESLGLPGQGLRARALDVGSPYLTIYEIESDDVTAVMEASSAYVKAGKMAPSDEPLVEGNATLCQTYSHL